MAIDPLTEMLWQELERPIPRARAKGLAGKEHWSDLGKGDLLAAAVKARPGDIEHWYALADHWIDKGNFMHAARILDQTIALFPEAAGAYARRADALSRIAPEQSARDAKRALALGAPPREKAMSVQIRQPAAEDGVATIYADITDMMEYLAHNMSMSGIQRVVANMLRCAKDRTSPNARDVRPVIPDYLNKIVYVADPELVRELIDAVELRKPGRDHLNRLLGAIWSSLRAIDLTAGDILLTAGAFWIIKSFDLMKLLRQRGVTVTVFVHDLIQIDNPEFVDEQATIAFRRCLIDVAEVASFFTTNSAFVARELRRFLVDEVGLATPVYPVPLATEMQLSAPEPGQAESIRAEFGDAGYVLCVCTIEIRKNHIYLVRLWKELMSSGRRNLPKLVFVGKWGWEIEHLQDVLNKTNNLDGMIEIMTGVSDSMLISLYRNSLFTIYPSFAEGWGLPIGESLVLGTPCVSAGVTSMPEVGGDLVRYIDPLDLQSGLEVVVPLLDDPDELSRWREDIAARFTPRTWADFAEELLGATRALAAANTSIPVAFARIRPAEFAIVGNDAVRRAAGRKMPMRTLRMAREYGWHRVRDEGVWTSSSLAMLRFIALGCAPGEAIRVAVSLAAPKGERIPQCQLRSGDRRSDFRPLNSVASFHSIDTEVSPDRTVEISIFVRGKPSVLEDEQVYACLIGLGYHRTDNDDEALRLLEAAAFQP